MTRSARPTRNRSRRRIRRNLYDSYIRAFRWASDRIGEHGVICFVSNGSFIDTNTFDGFRKTLADEFSSMYCFNLRGNQRTSGETSRREGGKVFGQGSRTPVAITLLVKNPNSAGPCDINYYDIGDYLSREAKLSIIETFGSVADVPWTRIKPDLTATGLTNGTRPSGPLRHSATKRGVQHFAFSR